jgi:hypothetical protein
MSADQAAKSERYTLEVFGFPSSLVLREAIGNGTNTMTLAGAADAGTNRYATMCGAFDVDMCDIGTALQADGSVVATGYLSMGGFDIANVASLTADFGYVGQVFSDSVDGVDVSPMLVNAASGSAARFRSNEDTDLGGNTATFRGATSQAGDYEVISCGTSSVDLCDVTSFAGTASTTNATVTPIATYTATNGNAYTATCRATARKSDGSESAGYGVVGLFACAAGTCTQIGASGDLFAPIESDALWNVTFTTSGLGITFNAVGDGLEATAINWVGKCQLLQAP